jgi:hypothetical protein
MRKNRIDRTCSMRGNDKMYEVLVGKPKGNKALRRSRHSLEDNIETDFKERGWECVDWVQLAKVRDRWWILPNTAFLSTGSIRGTVFLD